MKEVLILLQTVANEAGESNRRPLAPIAREFNEVHNYTNIVI